MHEQVETNKTPLPSSASTKTTPHEASIHADHASLSCDLRQNPERNSENELTDPFYWVSLHVKSACSFCCSATVATATAFALQTCLLGQVDLHSTRTRKRHKYTATHIESMDAIVPHTYLSNTWPVHSPSRRLSEQGHFKPNRNNTLENHTCISQRPYMFPK